MLNQTFYEDWKIVCKGAQKSFIECLYMYSTLNKMEWTCVFDKVKNMLSIQYGMNSIYNLSTENAQHNSDRLVIMARNG